MIENPIIFLTIYNAIIIGTIYGRKNLKKAIIIYIPAFLASSIIIYEHLTKIEKFIYWYVVLIVSITSIIAIWKTREKKQKIQYTKNQGTTYEKAKKILKS